MSIEHYNAARTRAAVVHQDWLGILKLTGPERQTWLQGMVTNEVEKLTPGQGCYAAHLNAQGRVVAQMIVLVAEEEVWLLLERSATDKLAAAFDKLIIMEDVQVQDASEQYRVLGLIGPQSRAVLEPWAGQPFADTTLYSHKTVEQGRVCVSDLGYDAIVPVERFDQAVQGLTASGIAEIDRETWNVLRVEAGLPLYGIDVDETTTLPELGQRGISYDKGCYIGQEVVARIKYIGHVNRRFVGFVCESAVIPEPRAAVQSNGKDAGYITSAVLSPGLNKVIALGFVNRVVAEPGTSVTLAGKAVAVPAVVSALPFTGRSGG